jgi:hypothetical protein
MVPDSALDSTYCLFSKGTSYSGIRIFNILPQSITSFRNEKPQFKVVLKIVCVHTAFRMWMNYMRVQMIHISHLHDCVNSYCAIIFMSCMLLYFFDMFHVLLSGDSLRGLWNAYICIYVTRHFIPFQGQN